MPFAVSTTSRTVTAPAASIRAELVRALRDLQFEVTVEQVTLLEARRGSQLAAAALQLKRLPVLAAIRINASDEGASAAAQTVVQVRLTDGWHSGAGRALGLSRSYAEVFAEVHGRIDVALHVVDPTVATPPPQALGGAPDAGLLDRVTARSGSFGNAGPSRVEGWLEGRAASTPDAWRSVAGVRLVSSEGEALLPLARVQTMLTVALLVSRSPGSMPERLAADVERFAGRLEAELGMPAGGAPRLSVPAEEMPVVRFLWEQARIRESLPLRTLQRCTTCRHEKVVNPDFKRLVERNRKIRGIGGALGASVSSHGASPFFLVGRLLPLAKLDPDYVCPRCQGLESDDRVIVFCPNCGERRDEAVLKNCARCSHSFRGALPPEQLWVEVVPEPAPAPAELPPPMGPPVLTAAPPPVFAPPAGVPVLAANPPARPAAWLPDPSGRHEARWWDGLRWTDQVLDRGRVSQDGRP
jgi:hypothetical protein